jgi:DNA-binding response OmpR family regulator
MTADSSVPAGVATSAPLLCQSDAARRLLVVEAEGDLRQLNAEVLVDAGYQVDAAEDGRAAWTALQVHHYDLLITDQFLPKVSGVELLKKLHNARMNLPVIMATDILPNWEFALHPGLQSVAMLRSPRTFQKLLDLVRKLLPPAAGVRAATAPAPNGHSPSAAGAWPP